MQECLAMPVGFCLPPITACHLNEARQPINPCGAYNRLVSLSKLPMFLRYCFMVFHFMENSNGIEYLYASRIRHPDIYTTVDIINSYHYSAKDLFCLTFMINTTPIMKLIRQTRSITW